MMPAPAPAAPAPAAPAAQQVNPPVAPANGGRVTFAEPPGGWVRWNSRSPLVDTLREMYKAGNFDKMSARDIQVNFPQFRVFNPVNFEKNFSRMKLDLGVRQSVQVQSSSAFTAAAMAAVAAEANQQAAAFQPHSSIPMEAETPHVQSMTLPYVMDTWFDGETEYLSFQIHHPTGPALSWYVSECQTKLICDYWMSKNARDPRSALKGFKDMEGNPLYRSHHVRAIARKKTIRDMENPETGLVLWRMTVDLPFKVDKTFSILEEEMEKYVKFSKNGEVWLFLHLIKEGGRRVRSSASNPSARSVAGVPSNISIVSGTVDGTRADAVDDLTDRFSVWSTPTTTTRARSRVSRSSRNGRAAMSVDTRSHTYRTVTSAGTPLPAVPEVGEPNPNGNLSQTEAAAGAAAAAAVATPPTDNTVHTRASKRQRVGEEVPPMVQTVKEVGEEAAGN